MSFGKIFESIYDSSIAEDWKAMIVFQQLIVLCDRNGIIDMTSEAIARRTNIPLEVIEYGLKILQEPDVESRSPLMQGKRIVLLEPEDRNWGWLIVNHEYYRNLQSQDERKQYMSKYMKTYMKEKRNGKAVVKPKHEKRSIQYSANFEEWWKIYPARKGIKAGKEAALEEFEKIIRSDEDFEQLMRATKRYGDVELPKDGERFLKKNYWRDWIGPDAKDVKPGIMASFKDKDGIIWQMGEGGWKQIVKQKE